MILNLTNVISGKLSQMPFEMTLIPDLTEFEIYGAESVSPFEIKGRVERRGVELEIELHYVGSFGFSCNRCLKPVELKFERNLTKQIIRQGGEFIEEDEESLFIEDYSVDIERLVIDEIHLSMPIQVLCDDSCRGICPKCGQLLNEGECTCSEDGVDPRLESLKNFFSQN
jgi:uncharacterized protein